MGRSCSGNPSEEDSHTRMLTTVYLQDRVIRKRCFQWPYCYCTRERLPLHRFLHESMFWLPLWLHSIVKYNYPFWIGRMNVLRSKSRFTAFFISSFQSYELYLVLDCIWRVVVWNKKMLLHCGNPSFWCAIWWYDSRKKSWPWRVLWYAVMCEKSVFSTPLRKNKGEYATKCQYITYTMMTLQVTSFESSWRHTTHCLLTTISHSFLPSPQQRQLLHVWLPSDRSDWQPISW